MKFNPFAFTGPSEQGVQGGATPLPPPPNFGRQKSKAFFFKRPWITAGIKLFKNKGFLLFLQNMGRGALTQKRTFLRFCTGCLLKPCRRPHRTAVIGLVIKWWAKNGRLIISIETEKSYSKKEWRFQKWNGSAKNRKAAPSERISPHFYFVIIVLLRGKSTAVKVLEGPKGPKLQAYNYLYVNVSSNGVCFLSLNEFLRSNIGRFFPILFTYFKIFLHFKSVQFRCHIDTTPW